MGNNIHKSPPIMLRGPRKKWSMRDSLQRVHFDQVVTDSHFLTRWPVPLLVAFAYFPPSTCLAVQGLSTRRWQ